MDKILTSQGPNTRKAGSRRPAVLLLGARLNSDGTPGPALSRRTALAAELAQELDAWLIFSGGPQGASPTEAEAAAQIALEMGVKEHRLLLEPKARTTFENIRFARDILKARNCATTYLVTDPYHMPRARLIAWSFGLSLIPAPTAHRARPGQIAREALALVAALLPALARRRAL